MIIRICRIAGAAAAVLLTAVGLFAFPAAVAVLWGVAMLLVGPSVAVWVHSPPPGGSGNPWSASVRAGAVAAAATMVTTAITAGLIALSPVVAAPVIAATLTGAGVWAFRRHDTGRSPLDHLRTAIVRSSVARPSNGVAPSAAGTTRPVDPQTRPMMPVRYDDMPTLDLCAVWQHTCWQLLSMQPGPLHSAVVGMRQAVLDELERRDPAGFDRWLQTRPRAGSDPGRYLTVTR